MTQVKWWKIGKQSLALAAREAGFDLTVYDDYGETVREELKKRAIKNIIRSIENEFEVVSDKYLSDIKQGVYVVCLSYPYTIRYNNWLSDIVYIGRGNISGRLKSHFEQSLFRLMRTLAGADFEFYLTEPKSTDEGYFKHIEYMLLAKFKEKAQVYPLLNKNAGSEQKINSIGAGWDKPLKNTGKRPIWQIEPTKHWDISVLD